MKALRILAVTMVLTASGAMAQKADAARKIDFTTVLTGFDGKPLMGGDSKSPEPLTLGAAAATALETVLPDDRLTQTQKLDMDTLARKVYKAKAITLTATEIAMIEDRISKAFGPMVVGPSLRLLDPANNE